MRVFVSAMHHKTTHVASKESGTFLLSLQYKLLLSQFAVDAVFPLALDTNRHMVFLVFPVKPVMLVLITERNVTLLAETVESLRSFAGLLFGLLKLVLLLLVFCFSLSHSYNYNLN